MVMHEKVEIPASNTKKSLAEILKTKVLLKTMNILKMETRV